MTFLQTIINNGHSESEIKHKEPLTDKGVQIGQYTEYDKCPADFGLVTKDEQKIVCVECRGNCEFCWRTDPENDDWFEIMVRPKRS